MEKKQEPVKIIHYCWFGPKPLSKLAKECMQTWKKFLPDYEIKLWNEDNFDFTQNIFVKEAYENKKWAFVADYARLKALSEYGGIYFDTDIEITKDLTEILKNDVFMGIEDSGLVNAAVIGAKTPHNEFIDDMIKIYDSLEKFDIENIYDYTIPSLVTKKLKEYGLDQQSKKVQYLNDNKITVYPREYFYPLSYDYQDNIFTDNTVMVHRYDATWTSKPEKAKLFFRRHNMKFMMETVDIAVCLKRGIKSIVNSKMFWTFLLISILFFGILSKTEFSADTYTVFTNDISEVLGVFLSAGRFITAAYMYLCNIFGFTINLTYLGSFCIGIISLTFALYKMYRISEKLTNNKMVSALSSILIVLNLFSFELWLFLEKGIMLLSVLFSVMAVDSMLKYFQGKKKYIVFAFIFMILANCSYQGIVGLFVTISLILILKYSKDIKDFIIKNVTVALVYGVPAFLNFFVAKLIFHNNRLAGSERSFIDKISKIYISLKDVVIKTYNVIPKYIFLNIIILLSVIIVYFIIRKNKGIKNKVLGIFSLGYLFAGTVLAAIAPQILVDYDSIWLMPRSIFSLASIVGILFLYINTNYNVNKLLGKALFIVLTLFICLQYVGFSRVLINRYTLNYLDELYAQQIVKIINKYEETEGRVINNIAVYYDNVRTYGYPSIKILGDSNVSALNTDWACSHVISFVSNRKFNSVPGDDEVFKAYFEGKDFSGFDNKEQFIFIGDTLHLCIY